MKQFTFFEISFSSIWLLLLLVVITASLIIVSTNSSVLAQGDNPSTCVNLYNSKITSMTINNINNHGSQTIPVNISNSNTKFDSVIGLGYNVTFTVHTAATSTHNNTDPGSVWYDTSAEGFQQGKCINGASANKDMTINYCCSKGGSFTDGIVYTPQWYTWPNLSTPSYYYTVTWHQLTVANTSPTNGATGIPVTGSITATFSKQVDSSTVNTNTFIIKDSNNNAVPGTVSLSSDGKTATFTPLSSNPLSFSTTYTVTITTGVKDLSGYPLAINSGPNYKWSFTTVPAPPPATPHSTTLTLNSISSSPVPAGNYITVAGKLTDNDASGAGVGGKTITFSGTGAQVAGGVGSASGIVTNADGSFTATARSTGTVGTGWTVQAHFAGDSYDKASDSTIQTYSTVIHTTTLTLNTITSTPSGTAITVTGKLTDNDASGQGISGETITFTGTGASNLASVTTNTDGTFIVTGTAPTTVNSGWTVQAHFAGDNYYKVSDSTTQSYSTLGNNSPKHTSTLVLNTVANVPWGTKDTVTGKLTDSSAGSNNVGIGGKTITFTSPDSSPLPPSVTTNTDGTFSLSLTASNTVFTGWQLQAHFAGDSNYTSSDSSTQAYNTIKHTTSLAFTSLPGNTPWSNPTSFTVLLTDKSSNNAPLPGKTIHFTGTGVINVADQTTAASTGKATGAGVAPNTVGTGWTVQGQFTGDSLYSATSTSVRSYNTVKHATSLSLAISPTSVTSGGSYSVSGTLKDSTKSVGLASKSITFTATSPITINSQSSSSSGQYSVTGLAAPSTASSYSIQTHFAGDSLYNAVDSPVRILTVKTTTAAAPIAAATPLTAAAPSSGVQAEIAPIAPAAPSSTVSPSQSLAPQSSINTNSNYTAQSNKLPPTSSPSSLPSPSLSQSPSPPLTLGSSSNNNSPSKNSVSQPSSSSQLQKQLQQQNYPYSDRLPLSPYQYPSQPSYPYSTQQQQQGKQQQTQLQQPPIANPGLSETVNENTKVTLDGRLSYSMNGGIVVAYQWTQLATGVPVTLTGANTATAAFIAPVVPTDTVLAFSLRVADNHGAISNNPAVVYVMVKHKPNNIGSFGNAAGSTTTIQPQQQHQPIVPNNNNGISPNSQPTSPSISVPHIGPPTIRSAVPTGLP